MELKERAKSVTAMAGGLLNAFFSFIVFTFFDLLDILLCYFYKAADLVMDAECKPCYCSPAKGAVTWSNGEILVSDAAEPKIFRLTSSKLQLDEISDTLFTRPPVMEEFALKKSPRRRSGSMYSVNSEMLQQRIVGKQKLSSPRWSDCDCSACISCCKDSLFVKMDGTGGGEEDVLFIHGFISSSGFWTETLYPNFSPKAKSKYRFFAVDLLGFGRSPKPEDSLYTLREHVEMIESSVLGAHDVKSFHIVAHSLGSILALALALKHPGRVKSLTLLAPPCFPVPRGENATQYMMRRVAPRRIWPAYAFAASLGCWYEHVSRTVCLLLSRQHRVWESLAKLLTRNRMRTYLIEGFFMHTHTAAWHTLHNVMCGGGARMERYLDEVNTRLNCPVVLYHGKKDSLIPVECSHNFRSRVERARLRVVENKDHITIVVGRQRDFARELEEIWENATG